MRNLNLTPSEKMTHCAPNRWDPRGWNLGKKLTALAFIAIVIAVIGVAIFVALFQ